jgi:hypothetical protein
MQHGPDAELESTRRHFNAFHIEAANISHVQFLKCLLDARVRLLLRLNDFEYMIVLRVL